MKDIMQCPECRGEMKAKKATLHFERDNFYADIESVPAYLCSQCGTRLIPGVVAENVSDVVENLFHNARAKSELPEEFQSPCFSGISFHRI